MLTQLKMYKSCIDDEKNKTVYRFYKLIEEKERTIAHTHILSSFYSLIIGQNIKTNQKKHKN